MGDKLGEVDELIFDEHAKKVRYIVLDLDDNDLDLEERKVLVPIGLAEIHESNNEVILSKVTKELLSALSEYDKDHLGPDVENSVLGVFSGNDTDHDIYNDSNL